MSTLTAAKRDKLPKKAFGLPGEKKYPMPDKAHAANAKARATQQVNKGNLSPAQKAKIDAKANKVLAGKSMMGGEHEMSTMDMIDREVAKRRKKS